jgi:hypothetical protein
VEIDDHGQESPSESKDQNRKKSLPQGEWYLLKRPGRQVKGARDFFTIHFLIRKLLI